MKHSAFIIVFIFFIEIIIFIICQDYTDSMKKLDPDGLYALVTHNNHNKNNNNNNSDTRSNDNNNNNNNKIGNINNEIAQTLLFCHSKKNCENVALLMAQLFTLNKFAKLFGLHVYCYRKIALFNVHLLCVIYRALRFFWRYMNGCSYEVASYRTYRLRH